MIKRLNNHGDEAERSQVIAQIEASHAGAAPPRFPGDQAGRCLGQRSPAAAFPGNAGSLNWTHEADLHEPRRFRATTDGGMKIKVLIILAISALSANIRCATVEPAEPEFPIPSQPGMLKSEFIFATGNVPFAECHASTIAETKQGLLTAWFGGSGEGHLDVGIWLSRLESGVWSTPVEVAVGKQSDGSREPCWNPVLIQTKAGPLLLFYKVGPSPRKWWGMMMTSEDQGATWSTAQRLPQGILGPIKNKPIELRSGDLLCPSSTEDNGWRVHFERTADFGKTWQATEPVNDGKEFAAIQPTILLHAEGKLQALGRTRQGKIFEIWSEDSGRTWGKMTATPLPNPNSGIDAVTLTDGRQLL